jgi:hypothetical protein
LATRNFEPLNDAPVHWKKRPSDCQINPSGNTELRISNVEYRRIVHP